MLKVKKLSPHAIIPTRATEGSVGYDLHSADELDTHIPPNSRGVVSTGIAVSLPHNTYGRIASRSGLSVKNGIEVGGGVVDRDYTGEIKVILFNHDSKHWMHVKKGYKIAQLILESCVTPGVEEVEELVETERGSNGFGSTGVTSPKDSNHVFAEQELNSLAT